MPEHEALGPERLVAVPSGHHVRGVHTIVAFTGPRVDEALI